MSNRFWTDNKQRSVSASGHGPAYGRDGGKVLDDTETQPKYNENIGPDGPDLNRVGFPTVKAFVKARFERYGSNYDQWDAPGGFGGPAVEKTDYGKIAGQVGKALGAIGGSVDTEDKADLKVYEPSGRNSGSAQVETQFSPRVKRYGQ